MLNAIIADCLNYNLDIVLYAVHAGLGQKFNGGTE